MIESPTILLIGSDDAVVSAAAASLGAAHYRTLTRITAADARGPDLVLRQWDDQSNGPIESSVPVLNVDLTRLDEQELIELVDRVVGFPAIVMRSALGPHD